MRKKDEMELQVSYKAVKITWFITVMSLFILGIIDTFDTGENNIFLVIASLSVVLYIFLERYYLSKVDEETNFTKYVAVVVILVAAILLILWLIR